MAQAPRADQGDSFVRHIVQDPKNVPDVMMLFGYPGASSEDGHERIYLSADLSSYVEVPNGAILHRAEAAKDQGPQGGATFWIKKDAALQYKNAPAQEAAQQAMAWYFAGALQGGGGAAPPAAAALPQTLPNAQCPVSLAQAVCPISFNPPCLTHNATCLATCHATCFPHATCQATCAATCAPHATCGATCIATCHATCFPHATCAATCVATCHATCVASCDFTCAHICTHATPCKPTLDQPQCPFPTEICTHVGGCGPLTHNCQQPAAMAAATPPHTIQAPCLQTIAATCAQHCLPTQIGTCNVACHPTLVTCNINICNPTHNTCNAACHHTLVTCNVNICNPTNNGIACGITHNTCLVVCQFTHNVGCITQAVCPTHNPADCPVASGALCPPQSLGCPQGSLACGFSAGCGFPQPGGEEAAMRRPPQFSVFCTVGVACFSVGFGCPPRTPFCPK